MYLFASKHSLPNLSICLLQSKGAKTSPCMTKSLMIVCSVCFRIVCTIRIVCTNPNPPLYFYGRCPEGIGRHNVKMSFCLAVCLVTFSRPLIGQKYHRHWGRGRWVPRRQNTVETIHANGNKGNTKRLNWAVPHSEPNKKNGPPPNLHTAAVYVASRNFLLLNACIS